MTLDETSAPALPRHVKLRHDAARDRWVLLAPERMLVPDETAVLVLQRLDGATTVGDVADALAAEYDAPRDVILRDVLALLRDLAAKRLLTVADAPASAEHPPAPTPASADAPTGADAASDADAPPPASSSDDA